MNEMIQPLLERIHAEGLKKAESDREAILRQAREDAERLLASARADAEELKRGAAKEADALLSRGKASLEQAARDVLLRLRNEIARQVQAAARSAAAGPLSSADQVAALLKELVSARAQGSRVTVEAGPELAGKLKELLPSLLRDAGASGGELVLNPRTGAGFELRFGEGGECLDLGEAAVADWLVSHLRADLAALLKPEAGS